MVRWWQCVEMTATLERGEVVVTKKLMVQQKKCVSVEGDVEMAGRQFSENSCLKLRT